LELSGTPRTVLAKEPKEAPWKSEGRWPIQRQNRNPSAARPRNVQKTVGRGEPGAVGIKKKKGSGFSFGGFVAPRDWRCGRKIQCTKKKKTKKRDQKKGKKRKTIKHVW